MKERQRRRNESFNNKRQGMFQYHTTSKTERLTNHCFRDRTTIVICEKYFIFTRCFTLVSVQAWLLSSFVDFTMTYEPDTFNRTKKGIVISCFNLL